MMFLAQKVVSSLALYRENVLATIINLKMIPVKSSISMKDKKLL